MKITIRILLATLLALILVNGVGAAQATNENWYKRVYTGLDKQQINLLAKKLFESEGYRVAPIRPDGDIVASEWLEVTPAELEKGWRERRRFKSAMYMRTGDAKKNILVIDFIKERLAPGETRWKNQRIDFYNDKYYRSMLKKMDQLVIDAGGHASDMRE